MEKKYRISSAQLLFLVICSRIMFAYTYLPVVSTPPHNQDAWIVAILSTGYTLLFSLPVFFLINRFGGSTYDQMLETILGRFFGKAVLCVFALFFFYCSSACTLLGAVFINSYLFPETPSWVLLLFTILPAMYASLKGAGTLARLAFFVVPYILLTVVLFFLMSMDQLDYTILLPMFADSSFAELNLGGMLTAGYFSEALVFLVLFPYLKEGSNVNKTLVWSSLLFTAAFLVMVIPTLTLLGLDVARHSWNPYYMFTRQVTAYEFIQRVESLNVIAWFLGVLIKTALFNYLACFTLSKVFGTRSHRAYIGPVFLITFLVNLLPFVNRSSVIDLLRSHLVFPPIVLFNIVVLPSVVIIVYLFRRKSIDPRLRGGAEKKTRGGGKPRPAQGGP